MPLSNAWEAGEWSMFFFKAKYLGFILFILKKLNIFDCFFLQNLMVNCIRYNPREQEMHWIHYNVVCFPPRISLWEVHCLSQNAVKSCPRRPSGFSNEWKFQNFFEKSSKIFLTILFYSIARSDENALVAAHSSWETQNFGEVGKLWKMWFFEFLESIYKLFWHLQDCSITLQDHQRDRNSRRKIHDSKKIYNFSYLTFSLKLMPHKQMDKGYAGRYIESNEIIFTLLTIYRLFPSTNPCKKSNF